MRERRQLEISSTSFYCPTPPFVHHKASQTQHHDQDLTRLYLTHNYRRRPIRIWVTAAAQTGQHEHDCYDSCNSLHFILCLWPCAS